MKKFIIRFLWGVGTGIVLIFVSSGILVFQRNLTISRVQASPSPECEVSGNLVVSGDLSVGGTSYGTVKNGSAWVKIDNTCVASDPGCAGSTAAGNDRGCCACYHYSPQGTCLFTVGTDYDPLSTSQADWTQELGTCYYEWNTTAWAFCAY